MDDAFTVAVPDIRRRRLDLVVVLAAAWFARAVFIVVVPARAHSVDVDGWLRVAAELRSGANPYVTTHLLNWPPLWPGCIWLIDHAARAFNISFLLMLRLFLILIESVLIVVLYLFLARSAPREARKIVLIGISLNPIAILLVCQHGNFDVIVGLCCFVAVLALARAVPAAGTVAWVVGALALGVGILAKTIPLASFAPLLAQGARGVSWRARATGTAFFLLPGFIGVGVLYVLAPHAIMENVIRYRSSPGWYGFTGITELAGLHTLTTLYAHFVYALVALIWVTVGSVVLWRHPLDERRLLLLAFLVLFAVPALGPGYAPQYAYWWLPFLVACYPLFDRVWRRAVLFFAAVATVDYIGEYAFFPSHGAFLDVFFPSSSFVQDVGLRAVGSDWQTEFRMPLFVASLVLLAVGVRRLGPGG